MRILGIDPGTSRIGYGLIEKGKELKLLKYGVIEVKSKGAADKLFEMAGKLAALLDKLKPEVAGVEKLFFAKNQKTALSVSEARGVIIYLLLKKRVEVREVMPREVKLAVTSYGFADKIAVARMVKKILKIDELKGHDDASDALAIAITAAFSVNRLSEAAKEA